MAAPRTTRFPQRARLRRGADFRHVFRQGFRVDGALFTLVGLARGEGESRLGLAAGRRAGGAVARNRMKRLLREAFRRQGQGDAALDVVVLPKAAMAESGLAEVEREYARQWRRLVARQARGPRGRPSQEGAVSREGGSGGARGPSLSGEARGRKSIPPR